MRLLFVLAASSVSSWLLTGAVRAYSLRRGILDWPGERSSHRAPTPRGGGLAFVLVWFATLAAVAWWRPDVRRVAAVLLVGGTIVGTVGWLDDRRGLSAAVRALAHALAATVAVVALGGLPQLDLGMGRLFLGDAGAVLAVVAIVWCTNLYNFMDGIDGLAASEAVAVATIGGTLLAIAGDGGLALVAWLLAASVAGFLPWNWAPARVFMGDVGSGVLGYALAVLALASERRGSLQILAWLLLLLVFVVDATATLLRRLLRGERWYEAHRSHAYQRAVQSGFGHGTVAAVVLAIDGGLAAAAFLVQKKPGVTLPVVASSATALLLLWAGFALRSVAARRNDTAS